MSKFVEQNEEGEGRNKINTKIILSTPEVWTGMRVSVFLFVNVPVLIIPLLVVIIAIVLHSFYLLLVSDVVVVEYIQYLLVTSWCRFCSIAVAVDTCSCVAVAVGSALLCKFIEMYIRTSTQISIPLVHGNTAQYK